MVKKILIVEDQIDIRDAVKIQLKKEGYKVTTAINAEECYKKWKSGKPDLVLMDIRMPGTPVKEIIPKMKNSKIIYLTAVGVSEAEREKLLKMENIVGFIEKPFSHKELMEKIKEII